MPNQSTFPIKLCLHFFPIPLGSRQGMDKPISWGPFQASLLYSFDFSCLLSAQSVYTERQYVLTSFKDEAAHSAFLTWSISQGQGSPLHCSPLLFSWAKPNQDLDMADVSQMFPETQVAPQYIFRIFLNHSANVSEIRRLPVRHFGYDSELVTSILHSSSSWALENGFKALCNPFPEKHYGGRQHELLFIFTVWTVDQWQMFLIALSKWK